MIETLYESGYRTELLDSAILEMNKAFHKELTIILRIYREKNSIAAINNLERKKIEQYFYYDYLNGYIDNNYNELNNIFDNNFNKEGRVEASLEESIEYLNKRMNNSEKEEKNIINSLITRTETRGNPEFFEEIAKKYDEYIDSKEVDQKQLTILNLTATGNEKEDLNIALSFLEKTYEKLVNYHYAAIIFENNDNNFINWSTISKTAIFAENFKESEDFPPFKRNQKKQRENLIQFLKDNKYLDIENEDIDRIASHFYKKQSYGFVFSDLLISEDLNKKVLILQKIEYESEDILCPDCLDDNPGGNSYSKVMFKSFECANSHCISRSKSGRGKRYNYLSAKVNTKMNFLDPRDEISYEIYRNFRRDIFEGDLDVVEMLVKLYSYTDDDILFYRNTKNDKEIKSFNRNIERKHLGSVKLNKDFNDLRIFELFNSIKDHIKETEETVEVNEDIEIFNANSTECVRKLKNNSFDSVITSPPYYNAREYSQWPTLISYLIDMFINSYYINKKISSDGVYLYNIGDIVDQDNIYVPSNMSKRKQILGLYSILIFEQAGWINNGNMIWDKGEVQSKRNSTANLSPYYVKPINCYEYVWIFTKKDNIHHYESIERINPVIKINSLGENLAQHSAPYPLDLVNLINDFITPESRVLDPFLGSGTTALWCVQNNYKCIGIELDKTFYELSKGRLNINTQMSLI